MDDVQKERDEIIQIVSQLSKMHSDNKSIVVALDFLKDCIEQRSNNGS